MLDDERLIFTKKDIPADKNTESFQRAVHNVLEFYSNISLYLYRGRKDMLGKRLLALLLSDPTCIYSSYSSCLRV